MQIHFISKATGAWRVPRVRCFLVAACYLTLLSMLGHWNSCSIHVCTYVLGSLGWFFNTARQNNKTREQLVKAFFFFFFLLWLVVLWAQSFFCTQVGNHSWRSHRVLGIKLVSAEHRASTISVSPKHVFDPAL